MALNPSLLLPLLLPHLFWILLILNPVASDNEGFIFNGFKGANLSLDGSAMITPEGLLKLTNSTRQVKGHAFYPIPIPFRNSTSGKIFSFSSTYVFGIMSDFPELGGNGIAFALSPTTNFSGVTGSQYLGLLNSSRNSNSTNHLFFVELDTIFNPEINDINDNHVGIDINGVRSVNSSVAGYYEDCSRVRFRNLTLISGDRMRVWVEYDGFKSQLNVTLAPINMSKPCIPLLSYTVANVSDVIKDKMFVGFSSSTGSFLTSHYILGWSFKMNGKAKELNISSLPQLPPRITAKSRKALGLWITLAVIGFLLAAISVSAFVVIRKIKFAEIMEDWEKEYGSHRFSYKDLYRVTKGFRESQLLGVGGFGRVYRGVLPNSKLEVAVKRVPHESRQCMKEFIAEIVGIGQLRHRNLVQQLGYCRRKGEILLVYDFMPNGSLDKLLFCPRSSLDWRKRFHIIKGVASGLYYLHEEWEKVVIHRDVKASNVLLDGDMNGRLGDFGLARLYDRGATPTSTRVVGTMGYLAPELSRTGRASKATDVYAFGVFLLEVVCGRRPIEAETEGEKMILVDWVLGNWRRGTILEVADPKLGRGYAVVEVELVLKLGLLCSHPLHTARPSMQQVMEILDGDAPLPELSYGLLSSTFLPSLQGVEMEDYLTSSNSPLLAESVLWTGR